MPLNVDFHNPIIAKILGLIHHYYAPTYWKYREYVTNPKVGCLIFKYFKLLYIKHCDAYNLASLGTDLNGGASFGSIPTLPHGLNGIIISPYAKIGKNVTIYHQVTIGDDGKDYHNVPIIGDNVIIGVGAKIIGKIIIGANVKIGAGAIVFENVPDGTTVVSQKPRIIYK